MTHFRSRCSRLLLLAAWTCGAQACGDEESPCASSGCHFPLLLELAAPPGAEPDEYVVTLAYTVPESPRTIVRCTTVLPPQLDDTFAADPRAKPAPRCEDLLPLKDSPRGPYGHGVSYGYGRFAFSAGMIDFHLTVDRDNQNLVSRRLQTELGYPNGAGCEPCSHGDVVVAIPDSPGDDARSGSDGSVPALVGVDLDAGRANDGGSSSDAGMDASVHLSDGGPLADGDDFSQQFEGGMR